MKERLKESVIKRFMTLAGTAPLSSTFLKEGGYDYARDDDEELGDEPAPDAALGGEGELDLGAEDPGMEEPGMEEPGMEDDSLGEEGAEEDLRDILAKEIEDMLGRLEDRGVIEITGDAGDEGELDLGGEEMAPEEEEEVDAALQEANIDYIDDNVLANKLLKRVASRLYKENKIDRLATRIANKLSRKK
tara:strand:+ start:1657 stop:2226 length:570 start_codon:yes stop_codon:yes gene_type:complete